LLAIRVARLRRFRSRRFRLCGRRDVKAGDVDGVEGVQALHVRRDRRLDPLAVVGDVRDAADGEEAAGARGGDGGTVEGEGEDGGNGGVFEAVLRVSFGRDLQVGLRGGRTVCR
jgi:hypothetical protein